MPSQLFKYAKLSAVGMSLFIFNWQCQESSLYVVRPPLHFISFCSGSRTQQVTLSLRLLTPDKELSIYLLHSTVICYTAKKKWNISESICQLLSIPLCSNNKYTNNNHILR